MLVWTAVVVIISVIGRYLYISGILFLRKRLSANNKAVLITGCDSGFGYFLAQRLSQLGYKVFAGCLFNEGEGAKKLKIFSSKIVILQLDVTKEDDIKNIRQRIVEEQGDTELWALVNNAGIMHLGDFELCQLDVIRKVFEVNTFGMMRMTKEVLPLLKKSKGRVVNVTSVNGEVRVPGSIGYSTSKAASKMFSDVIRLELRKWDIKVVNISPYAFSTGFGSPENIERLFRECWEKADPDVTSSLGEQYLEESIRNATAGVELLKNTHIDEAIDCMVDAISLKSPRLRYRPGNLLNRILFSIPTFLPECLIDSIQYSSMPKVKNN